MGRVKRNAGLAAAAAREAAVEAAPQTCWLCERALGTLFEWHHAVPRSRGGRATVPVHPICHRTIHAELSNAALAAGGGTRAMLLAEPGIARFVAWIADKPADFRKRVRRREAR